MVIHHRGPGGGGDSGLRAEVQAPELMRLLESNAAEIDWPSDDPRTHSLPSLRTHYFPRLLLHTHP